MCDSTYFLLQKGTRNLESKWLFINMFNTHSDDSYSSQPSCSPKHYTCPCPCCTLVFALLNTILAPVPAHWSCCPPPQRVAHYSSEHLLRYTHCSIPPLRGGECTHGSAPPQGVHTATLPLSSTTRVWSLQQSTGSPIISTSTKGSMICIKKEKVLWLVSHALVLITLRIN